MHKQIKKSTIDNFRHNAVLFEFKNGNNIDAIFGYGTYSDNYDMGRNNSSIEAFHTFAKSTTVESMYNCSARLEKKITKKYGEQPLNRISIEDWFKIANKIRKERRFLI